MMDNKDFIIRPCGDVSNEFLARDILTFSKAMQYVKGLPYGRSLNNKAPISVFEDQCGTCSSKHGLLKILANENGFQGLRLMLGIFKMSEQYSPKIYGTLMKYNLEYLPEAHNYLRIDNDVFDCTNLDSNPSDFLAVLIEEIEINIDQLTDFKVSYHKAFLKRWLNKTQSIKYNLDKLWSIRELCIEDLSTNVEIKKQTASNMMF